MEFAVYLGKTRKATCVDVDLLKEAIRSALTIDRAARLIQEVEHPAESLAATRVA
jgi:hypothetical protein